MNIGRIAATLVTVPFSTVQAQAPTHREQRLYAFAYTILKSVAAEMAAERRPAAAGHKGGAVRLAREANALILAAFPPYDALELRNIQASLGVAPYRGAPALSRAVVLREVAIEVARRLVAQSPSSDDALDKFARDDLGGLAAEPEDEEAAVQIIEQDDGSADEDE